MSAYQRPPKLPPVTPDRAEAARKRILRELLLRGARIAWGTYGEGKERQRFPQITFQGRVYWGEPGQSLGALAYQVAYSPSERERTWNEDAELLAAVEWLKEWDPRLEWFDLFPGLRVTNAARWVETLLRDVELGRGKGRDHCGAVEADVRQVWRMYEEGLVA